MEGNSRADGDPNAFLSVSTDHWEARSIPLRGTPTPFRAQAALELSDCWSPVKWPWPPHTARAVPGVAGVSL